MTRGKFIYIDRDLSKSLITTEFNGDMYPNGHGNVIISNFGVLRSVEAFTKFVEDFNEKNFRYPETLYRPFTEKEFDVSSNHTDYLYIVNNSGKDYIVNDVQDVPHRIPNRCLGIVNFDYFEEFREPPASTLIPISKEKFVEILDKLRDSNDLVDKVEELFRNSRENVECDFCNSAGLQISHESIVVELLEMLTHGRDDISYFIYELNYGRSYEPGMITDGNSEDIDFSSAEKLYEYLERTYV